MIICCFSSFVPCHVSKHTFGIDLFCIFSSFSFLLPSFFFIFLDNLSRVELDKLFPPSPSCLRLWPWLIAYYMEIRYYIFSNILQYSAILMNRRYWDISKYAFGLYHTKILYHIFYTPEYIMSWISKSGTIWLFSFS